MPRAKTIRNKKSANKNMRTKNKTSMHKGPQGQTENASQPAKNLAEDIRSTNPGPNRSPDSPLKWRAYEFYYHKKNFEWYLLAVLGSISIAVLAWLISGLDDYTSSGIILVALLGLTAYAGRKPEKKEYEVDGTTLKIDKKPINLNSFRSFWVEDLGTHIEITLVGIKRSTPPTTLYIKDENLANEVISRIGVNLPEDEASKNPFDWLARRIKF